MIDFLSVYSSACMTFSSFITVCVGQSIFLLSVLRASAAAFETKRGNRFFSRDIWVPPVDLLFVQFVAQFVIRSSHMLRVLISKS